MSLEDRGAQHDKIPVDKYHNPEIDYTMSTRDYVLRPAADGDSGPITITLPPVVEAKGRFYALLSRNADAVNTITITDNNSDSECWIADIVFNGKCDRALLYSDGLAWFVFGSVGAWPGIATTAPPGTASPTTLATTVAPSTAAPTTVGQSTTSAPTTVAATTVASTTLAPTTL